MSIRVNRAYVSLKTADQRETACSGHFNIFTVGSIGHSKDGHQRKHCFRMTIYTLNLALKSTSFVIYIRVTNKFKMLVNDND